MPDGPPGPAATGAPYVRGSLSADISQVACHLTATLSDARPPDQAFSPPSGVCGCENTPNQSDGAANLYCGGAADLFFSAPDKRVTWASRRDWRWSAPLNGPRFEIGLFLEMHSGCLLPPDSGVFWLWSRCRPVSPPCQFHGLDLLRAASMHGVGIGHARRAWSARLGARIAVRASPGDSAGIGPARNEATETDHDQTQRQADCGSW